MVQHIRINHEGFKIENTFDQHTVQCVFQANHQSQLKSKKQLTHTGVIYSILYIPENNNHQIPTDLYESLSIQIVVVKGQNSFIIPLYQKATNFHLFQRPL
jgi:hypothetical protein